LLSFCFHRYTNLQDAYLSVTKVKSQVCFCYLFVLFVGLQALQHACLACNRVCVILWIEAADLESDEKKEEAERLLRSADAVLVPGGFGERGIEGVIVWFV
jgi:CTP synthase (UTP-ammonia lyase)